MRILIVESDPITSRFMEMMFSHANFNAYTTDIATEALDLVKLYDYDLVIMEPATLGSDGLETVLLPMRNSKITTPVLIVSGKDDTEHKLKAFGFGADDFMSKPFHRDELIARAHAIIRRSNGHSHAVIETGSISVDLDSRTVKVAGDTVHLTGKEYEMMELLSLRKGTVLTKEMFLNHLYGGRDEPELQIIDVFICKLRKKLEAAGSGNHIETVWGRGYALRDPESSETSEPTEA